MDARQPAAAFTEDPAPAGPAPAGDGPGGGGLRVGILGPLLVVRDGAPVPVGPAMVRHLLALLALNSTRTVPRDEIVAALWDGDPPATAVNLVQVYVSRLRAQLRSDAGAAPGLGSSGRIKGDRSGYRLDLGPEGVDLARFDALLATARAAAAATATATPTATATATGAGAAGDGAGGGAAEALAAYEAALGCWRGPILEGVEPRLRQLPGAVAAEQRRVGAAMEYALLCAATGRHRAAVDVLSGVVETAPLHEGLHARLMLALAGAGDRAGAFATHAALRRRLSDELGVDPGPELRAAYQDLLRQDLLGQDLVREDDPADDADRAEPGPGRHDPGRPEEPAPAAPAAPVVDRHGADRHGADREGRERWGRVWQAAVGSAAGVLLAGGLTWAVIDRSEPARALPEQVADRASVSRTAGIDFAPTLRWDWAYGPELGSTPTGEQWVTAEVSGLTDSEHGAGFRLRVIGDPQGEGNDQGVLVAVFGDRWQIEAAPGDFGANPVPLPPSGVLRVSLTADNDLTVTYGDAVVLKQRLRANDYPGHRIFPAVWQNNEGAVRMTNIRTNAGLGAGRS